MIGVVCLRGWRTAPLRAAPVAKMTSGVLPAPPKKELRGFQESSALSLLCSFIRYWCASPFCALLYCCLIGLQHLHVAMVWFVAFECDFSLQQGQQDSKERKIEEPPSPSKQAPQQQTRPQNTPAQPPTTTTNEAQDNPYTSFSVDKVATSPVKHADTHKQSKPAEAQPQQQRHLLDDTCYVKHQKVPRVCSYSFVFFVLMPYSLRHSLQEGIKKTFLLVL